jgi:hypothetical protein
MEEDHQQGDPGLAAADELIRDLIATGTMNEDTLAELERMRADHAAGTLDPDDEGYLRALHARVTNAPMPEPVDVVATGPARLDGLTIEEWRDRALRAESELAETRELQPGTGS